MPLDSRPKAPQKARFAVAAITLALVTGCKAQIDIDLTDGPLEDAEQVVLQIEAVELRRADGSTTRIDTDQGADVDLLQYRNGDTLRLVSGHEIGATRFTGVRLIYARDGSYVSPLEENDVELTTPADPVFADVDFSLGEDDQIQLLIDLDLRFSLADRRSTLGEYQLQPYLRAAIPEETGRISGDIQDSLLETSACRRDRDVGDGVAIYIFAGSNPQLRDFVSGTTGPIASAALQGSAGSYHYEVALLDPGTYTVALTCDADRDDPLTSDALVFRASDTVSVEAEEESMLDLGS